MSALDFLSDATVLRVVLVDILRSGTERVALRYLSRVRSVQYRIQGQGHGGHMVSGTKVCVVGLGYIGLPTAAVLASRGYEIHGVEVNNEAARTINSGRAHIVEPELDILVRAAVSTGKLKAFPEPAPAEVFMLCVPTPFKERHEPDLSFVESATRSVAPHLKRGDLVILESTSPPGTTERIAQLVAEVRPDLGSNDVYFAHAPERVLPGKILREVVENDRIIGGINEASTEVCAQFYRSFVSGELHLTTSRMAETVKLVENASRDVGIAFANELSIFADAQGLDVWELIRLANHHPRVNILSPGPGVGGHCIAVDPWFLVHTEPDKTPLIRMAREVNSAKPAWVIQRVLGLASRFKSPKIACLGLAYKPDIDDLRESPALEIARALKASGDVRLLVVEPNIQKHPDFELCDVDFAIREADIVLFLVAHREFRRISPAQLSERVVVDTCGVTE